MRVAPWTSDVLDLMQGHCLPGRLRVSTPSLPPLKSSSHPSAPFGPGRRVGGIHEQLVVLPFLFLGLL